MNQLIKHSSYPYSPKYIAWKKSIEAAGCHIESMEAIHEIPKREGGLLFGLIRSDIKDPQGRRLMPYAMIRGDGTVIVTVVVNAESGEKKFLMIQQRRIAHGHLSLEFPAGMLDDLAHDPVAVAIREMEEETGLLVQASDIIPLSSKPLFSSPGLEDESIYFYACTLIMSSEKFAALEGTQTGLQQEHEYIQVSLWDYADAIHQTTSMHVRLGFYLYFDYVRAQNPEHGILP